MDYTRSEAKQAAREAFTGLWAAITTPFDPGGAVDYDALRRDLDRLTGGPGRRRHLLRRGDGRVLVAGRQREAPPGRGGGGRGPREVPGHRAHRAHLTAAGHRADPARAEGGRGLRGADQPVLPARLRRGPVPLVRDRVRGRGHRGLAVRHRVLRGVAAAGPHRAAGRHRERVRHQGRPGPRALPGGAGPGRRGRSWSASRTRGPGWRTSATTASGCSCPRPRRTCTRPRTGSRCATTPGWPWPGTSPRPRRSPPRWTRSGWWPRSGCTARPAGSTRSPRSRRGRAWLGMSGGPVRPPLLPHTEAEIAELAADLEAVGLLPGSGPAARARSNGHRPATG